VVVIEAAPALDGAAADVAATFETRCSVDPALIATACVRCCPATFIAG
jgi:hypothetical protein